MPNLENVFKSFQVPEELLDCDNTNDTVLQGLTQPKVSGYNNFSICTPLHYSYATLGLCAEIIDVPSYRVLDLQWGLNSFNW